MRLPFDSALQVLSGLVGLSFPDRGLRTKVVGIGVFLSIAFSSLFKVIGRIRKTRFPVEQCQIADG